MGCIFCSIVAGEAPAHLVYEDEATVAFLDIHPATPGHTLIVPRRHAADLWEIDDDTARAVIVAARRVAELLRVALAPAGLNLQQANGRAAGQEVFHLHVHLVPRYPADGLPLPWTATRSSTEELARIAARIRGR